MIQPTALDGNLKDRGFRNDVQREIGARRKSGTVDTWPRQAAQQLVQYSLEAEGASAVLARRGESISSRVTRVPVP